ncbi:type III secretion system inner membrane ring subunit SctD [Trinickia caryophylli]|uniref:Type III secretion protein D n=1 Tax=Trinickia caryophylli TaxID=28094 RepID=A0A1X7EX25_TRICW|nr:type III secretion system inner membrane ring subunit SctD [Trinickia caryophylli]PMS09691.1 EscD/YscD/HrpQ family type III secretion system inner membrane ring protein [Trinickia caryophylli]TRX18462.1 EscD/YscD/HrpQ family type III secretion system inner membrane ring protein [Trinickia caryophylli]WQE10753.1 type III secretion system inner membrane ring subunit SctD [Trinickia caryophylli]SMF41469.1 type III secretion protein D [Trinickia caryophylli]GLU33128.1 type III secretion system 
MEGQYKLKWLNGLLAGRELLLPAGELCLGAGEADVAVAFETDGEAVLCVDDDGVHIRSALPVWVEGTRWDLAQRLPLHAPVDLGGQAFVLGLAADTIVSRSVPERASRARGRASPVRWRLSCLAASCAALGAVVLLYPQTARQPDAANASRTDMRQWETVPGVHVATNPDGVVVLSGYCARSADIDALRRRLTASGRLVRDDTVCTDTLLASVREVLLSNGYRDAGVEPGNGDGTAVIHGDFAADARWRSTAAQLAAVPGLRGWSISDDRAQAFDALLRTLAARHLLDGVSLSVSGSTLMASGRLPPGTVRALNDTLAAFNAGAPALRAQFHDLPPAPPAAGLLPAAIVSLGGNVDSPFVELANGMRLQRGAVLPSGFVVYALDDAYLALRKGQQLIAVPLGL